MFKRFVGTALAVILVTGCGESWPGGSPTLEGQRSAPSTTSSTATPSRSSEAGFGAPAQNGLEFASLGTAQPVRSELQLAGNGCWYAALGESTYLAVLPVGYEISESDAMELVAPDGTTYGSETLVDGTAFELAFDQVPGGEDGRWGNYASFCDPEQRSFAVFETIGPAFDPTALGAGAIEEMAAGAVFTESWPCGRGWAVSTEDHMVGLFIYQRGDTEVTPGLPISLPDEAWSAEVIVGKHLFVNHCDDVFEPWEPNPVVGGQWPLSSGSLEILNELPNGADSAMVRAMLSAATVTTDSGTSISFDVVELQNRSFNFFAG